MLPYVQEIGRVIPHWVGSDCVKKASHTMSHDTCAGHLKPSEMGYRYELLAPLAFVDSGGYHHHINAGFRWNGMSAPMAAPRWIDDPLAEAAVCLHDSLCRTPPYGMTYWRVHSVFLEAMKASGVNEFKAELLIYVPVVLFGWWSWRRHRRAQDVSFPMPA